VKFEGTSQDEVIELFQYPFYHIKFLWPTL
jgi:hypothetical protein